MRCFTGQLIFYFFLFYMLRRCSGQVNRNSSSDMTQGRLEALYDFLLTGYEKNVRPSTDLTSTRVTSKLLLISLTGLDEPSGIMSTVGIVELQWTDQRIAWNSSDYGGIDEVLIPEENVWVPRIMLMNPVKKFRNIGAFSANVRYYSNGTATVNVGDYLDTSCDIDVTHYPFDRQNCSINFISTSSNFGAEVVMYVKDTTIDLTYFSPHGAWITKDTYAETGTFSPYTTPTYLKYTILLERRSSFIVINLFIPVVILVLLNCMVFLLPADSGERVGFAMTCLLALAVYLSLVSDNLPKIPQPLSVLTCVLLLCLMISTGICLMIIGSLRLHLKDSSKPVPLRIKKLVLYLTCRRSCLKKDRVNSVVHINIVDEMPSPKAKKSKTHEEKEKIPTKLEKEKISEKHAEKHGEKELSWCGEDENVTWKDVAELFDRVCFIFILSCTIALGVLYFMIVGGRL